MATFKLPQQFQLDASKFSDPNIKLLVNSINMFVLQAVQAFATATSRYRILSFTTTSDISASFPLDFPIDITPLSVTVAQCIAGNTNGLSNPVWSRLANGNVSINFIDGLEANQSYIIRLSIDS